MMSFEGPEPIEQPLIMPDFAGNYDYLTGLVNRAGFDREHRALNADMPGRYALSMMDLDGFKDINELEGHSAGDELLREVSRVLMETTRHEDMINGPREHDLATVARVGGDEFAILFPGVDNQQTLDEIINPRIQSAMDKHNLKGTINGLVHTPGISQEDFYAQADTYATKLKRRNQIESLSENERKFMLSLGNVATKGVNPDDLKELAMLEDITVSPRMLATLYPYLSGQKDL